MKNKLTIEQCKNEVAKENDFENWKDALEWHLSLKKPISPFDENETPLDILIDDSFLRYASQFNTSKQFDVKKLMEWMEGQLNDWELARDKSPTDVNSFAPILIASIIAKIESISESKSEVKGDVKNEEIDCPHCDGEGYHSIADDSKEKMPCGYCFCAGRITTKLMKEHIEENKLTMSEKEEDDLPF